MAGDSQAETVVHGLWMNGGLGCDGDSVALTVARSQASEDIAMGALPGLSKGQFHWPLVDCQVGDDFMQWW
jgi:hydrogenase small subunit